MIQCFDFAIKQWLNDVLHLGSRFFNYHAVGVPAIVGYKEKQKCTMFCLLTNGEKSESVHVACVGIVEHAKGKQVIMEEALKK